MTSDLFVSLSCSGSLKEVHSTKVHIGLAMKELGFEHTKRGCVAYYKAIPLKAA